MTNQPTNDQSTDLSYEARTSIGDTKTSSLRHKLSQKPYCFIADTVSIQYAIDTAANRIIVNDARYITYLVPTSDKIKRIP